MGTRAFFGVWAAAALLAHLAVLGEGAPCAALFEGPGCEKPRTLPCVGQPYSIEGNRWITLSQEAWGGEMTNPVPKSAIRKGMAAALPPVQAFGGARASAIRSCAVVGSASRLNKQKLGGVIDGMDLVLRFNNAPTKGHAAAVGSKTTVRMTNNRYSGFREGGEAVLGKMKFCDGKSMAACLAKNSKQVGIMLKKKVHPINPEFFQYVKEGFHRVAKGKNPSSSGYYAIVMLLHFCEKVDVFGIGASSYGDMRKWYWDKYPGFYGTMPPSRKRPSDMSAQVGKWARKEWSFASPLGAPAGAPAGGGAAGDDGGGGAGAARLLLGGTMTGGKRTRGGEDFTAEGQCLQRWASEGFITLH